MQDYIKFRDAFVAARKALKKTSMRPVVDADDLKHFAPKTVVSGGGGGITKKKTPKDTDAPTKKKKKNNDASKKA